MSQEFGGRTGLRGKLTQWLRGGAPKESAGDGGREALLLAAAKAGLPLAPRRPPGARLPLFL
ncbi:hypothetical protein GCM10020256_55230 [Streptomyces thermocoprophilus]